MYSCCTLTTMFLIYLPDLQLQKASLEEKEHAISETVSEIKQKEMQKEEIIQKIEKLKEEHSKRKNSKLVFWTSIAKLGL